MSLTTTSRGVQFIRPSVDEKSEQASVLNLTQQLGGFTYVLGTRRAQYCGTCGTRTTDQGTRQTPGLPDLLIYLPPPRSRPGTAWTALMFEVKGRGGVLSHEQVEFRYLNERAGVVHLVGGLDAFLAWLGAGGWVR